MNGDWLWGRSEIAAVFGVKPRTVGSWARTGRGRIPLYNIGGHLACRRSDIEAVFAGRRLVASSRDAYLPSVLAEAGRFA